jgi:phospholipase C
MAEGPASRQVSRTNPINRNSLFGRRATIVALVATIAVLVVVASLSVFGVPPTGGAGCGRTWQVQPATATPIKHLFVIVKENHAFENYFGDMPGVIGYPPNGTFPLAFNSSAVVHPFPLLGYSTADFPHDRASELVDFNGGLNNLFVAEANAEGTPNPQDAVGYYTAQQIPAYYEYARTYALGDEFFTGVLGPTNPNRVFDLSAYVGSWDADTPPPPNVTNQPTVLDQLTGRNIPWEYDYNGYPFALAPLWFPSLAGDPCSSSRITPDTNLSAQLASSTPPAVVYLDPSNSPTYSEHPPENVSVGEQWTVAIINTILESSVANSSAILVFFDEAGGYWDPVPPPLTSTGRDGFRVPLLVISPWTPAGKVCSTPVDSASVLRFIDANWGLPPLTSRVAAATSLSCFFDFSQPPRPPEILPTNVSFVTDPARSGVHPTEFSGLSAWLVLPGGGGQLTVVRAGNGRSLRKVPTPGNAGSGGSPTGESPSSGAETTQPDGTVKVTHRRFHRDMVKRPTPREQALTDGKRSFPDRRGERAVECCLEQNGAYYHDLAGTSVK